MGQLTGYSPCIGIAQANAALDKFLGFDTYGYSWYLWSTQLINNNVRPAYGTPFSTSDIIGVSFDTYTGTLAFYKNGVSQGVAYTGLSGTFFAAVSGAGAASQQVTVNFGASPFAYTVPAGFNAGLYSYSPGFFLIYFVIITSYLFIYLFFNFSFVTASTVFLLGSLGS